MKTTALLFLLLATLSFSALGEETISVTAADQEQIAQQLEMEAESQPHDKETKSFLKKISKVFKKSSKTHEVSVSTKEEDCSNCEGEPKKKKKKKNFFKTLGRKIGKGSAWLATTTAKPFMNATSFLTGLFEKKSKNQDLVALYQFLLNHQDELDELYLEAGTPEEMRELILAQIEEILERKSNILMREFLMSLELEREIPEDLTHFSLTPEELASIDPSKIDPRMINNHPEYRELKPLFGEFTEARLKDLVENGYFEAVIDFDLLQEMKPKTHEMVATVVTQIFAPKIALGVVSNTLAGLYVLPVVASQVGTGVSVAVCLDKDTQKKFEGDEDLRKFCSYVTNRSSYELVKSRAKGYVSGKKTREKIEKKLAERKARKAERKRLKEERKAAESAEREKLDASTDSLNVPLVH